MEGRPHEIERSGANARAVYSVLVTYLGRGDNGFEHRRCPLPCGDIVYLCSNKSTTSVTAAQLRDISASVGDSLREFQPRVKRGWNRLNTDQQAAVVTRYSNGETSTTLAEEYGVAKSTILRILREARVVVRRQPMTPDQVSEAAQLYQAGLSLSQVAKQLDVNQETMRAAIMRAGVVLREPTKAKTA